MQCFATVCTMLYMYLLAIRDLRLYLSIHADFEPCDIFQGSQPPTSFSHTVTCSTGHAVFQPAATDQMDWLVFHTLICVSYPHIWLVNIVQSACLVIERLLL